ncbi:hypothetical protein HELRODRAFT_141093, partial [Helobdella robusta]|uniref:Uncharacterized protein n=1 Tax=Helobdella robusta TaxID=6412 RepID=T1EJ26_HELRO
GPRTKLIFGNLRDLGTLPHRKLFQLSEQFENVYNLKLGKWKAVAVNGIQSCRNILIKNGKVTASRPNFESFKYYSHGRSLSFQPYNDIWLTQRKATSKIIAKLITTGSALDIAHRQMKGLVDNWSLKVESDMFDAFPDIVEAVGGFIYSLCYGENEILSANSEFKKILLDPNPGTDMFAVGNNIDLLPHVFQLFSMKKHQKHIDRMNYFLQLHNKMKEKVKHRLIQHRLQSNEKYFDDVRANEYNNIPDLHEDHFLNLPAEFLSAGTETSTAVLLWLLRYVALTPGVQDNVYNELKQYTSQKSNETTSVEYGDRPHLPYTESCLLESLRCMAVVPFALPHFTTNDFESDGLLIKKDTLILPNLWSVGRDPSVWSEPEKFIPERHLNTVRAKNGGDANFASSKSENFYPFGLGKRRCVGEPLGRMLNFILFSNIML